MGKQQHQHDRNDCAAAGSIRSTTCLMALAALLAGVPTDTAHAIGPAGSTWHPRELIATDVDLLEQRGADRALAFDHHGAPGVAYKAAGAFGDLHYARILPGLGWVGQDVFPNIGTNGRGAYPSLAFDRHERPAISYIRQDETLFDAELGFAYFDGQDWVSQTADAANNVDLGTWSALAFDHLGRAAIAYKDHTNLDLKYIHDTDGDFDFSDETPEVAVNFASAPFDGFYLSLAFDPMNRAMAVHTNNSGQLIYSVKETLAWFSAEIDPGGLAKSNSSLAIDPDTGYPAIAYRAGTSTLRFAQWDGSTWDVDDVDTVGFIGDISLAFDPTDGNPAIGYHRFDNASPVGELKIGWYDGSTWQTDVVDAGSGSNSIGFNPSIAFREFGTGDRVAAISYHDDSGNLYYIEDPPAVVPEPASLALLLTGGGLLMRRSDRRFPPNHG